MVARDTRRCHRHHWRGRDAPDRSSDDLRARRRPPVPEVRGNEPDGLVQGPRHDGGHEQGRRGGKPRLRLRLDGEHGGLGRGLRREGRRRVFRGRACGQDRLGQGGAGSRARGPDSPDRGQLRRCPRALAEDREGDRRGHAGELRQPRPHRGSEDGRLRGCGSPRKSPRRPGPARGQRGEHHIVLEGLQRVARGGAGRLGAAHARFSGRGRLAPGGRSRLREPRDGGERHQDRVSGQ